MVDISDMITVLLSMGRFNNFEICTKANVLFYCCRKEMAVANSGTSATSTAFGGD